MARNCVTRCRLAPPQSVINLETPLTIAILFSNGVTMQTTWSTTLLVVLSGALLPVIAQDVDLGIAASK